MILKIDKIQFNRFRFYKTKKINIIAIQNQNLDFKNRIAIGNHIVFKLLQLE